MGHNGRRVTFWGAAFFAWLVWALALAATAGADWISGSTLKVADSCSSYVVDSFCAKCESFLMIQVRAYHVQASWREESMYYRRVLPRQLVVMLVFVEPVDLRVKDHLIISMGLSIHSTYSNHVLGTSPI